MLDKEHKGKNKTTQKCKQCTNRSSKKEVEEVENFYGRAATVLHVAKITACSLKGKES